MEFITGLKQQEEAELEDLLKAEEGTTIILEGAVHSIRDMGEITCLTYPVHCHFPLTNGN